jgi:hypothetical protein
MTPRELLKAWLDLSENRHLSVETYLARDDRLVRKFERMHFNFQVPALSLMNRWSMLNMPDLHETVGPHEADPEKYWTARKQLERETRAYLEAE